MKIPIIFIQVLMGLSTSSLAMGAYVDRTSADTLTADLKEYQASMSLRTDGNGHYLAIIYKNPRSGVKAIVPDENTFWGDGNKFFQMRITHCDNKPKYAASFEENQIEDCSQRVIVLNQQPKALEDLATKDMTVNCRGKKSVYKVVSSDIAKGILAKAHFVPRPIVREPIYFFRDATGNYIYMDAIQDEYGNDTTRLFYGTAGSMKQIKIKSFNALLDGGTADITDESGAKIHISPPYENKAATRNGIEFEKMEPSPGNLAALKLPEVPTKLPKLSTPCDVAYKNNSNPDNSKAKDSPGTETANPNTKSD